MRLLMAPKDKITRDFGQGVQQASHVNMDEPAHKDVAQRRARNKAARRSPPHHQPKEEMMPGDRTTLTVDELADLIKPTFDYAPLLHVAEALIEQHPDTETLLRIANIGDRLFSFAIYAADERDDAVFFVKAFEEYREMVTTVLEAGIASGFCDDHDTATGEKIPTPWPPPMLS